MKKLMLILMCVLILPVFSAVSAEETAEMKYPLAAELVGSLDIMSADSTNFSETVTRAEFCGIVSKILPDGITGKNIDSRYGFKDVTEETEYYEDINKLYSVGLTDGGGSRLFNPEENITYEQAIKIFVRLTGFDAPAEIKGGYPTGYMITAQERGITKNISAANGTALTREQLAQLIANTLETDHMQISSVKGDSQTYDVSEESNLLYKKYGVKRLKGMLTAVGKTDMYGASGISSDKIKIDRFAMRKSDNVYFIKDDIGKSMDYYAETDENGSAEKLICFKWQEDKYEQHSFDYETYEDFKKDYKIADDAKIIYNSSYYTTYNVLKNEIEQSDNTELLYPKRGSVLITDIDTDGYIDVIIVKNVQYAYVGRADYSVGKIMLEYGAQIDGKEYFEAEDNIHLFMNGKPATLENVGAGDLLEIEKNMSGDTYNINICNESVSGIIYSISDDTLNIDEKEYPVTEKPMIYSADGAELGEFKLEQDGTFCFNSEGKIAFAKMSDSAGWQFGYLYKAAYVDEIGGSRIQCRLLTKSNEWLTVNANENTKIDGAKPKSLQDTYESWQKESGTIVNYMVRYKLGVNNILKELDTPNEVNDGNDKNAMKKVQEISNHRVDWTTGSNWEPTSVYKINNDTALLYLPNNLEDDEMISFVQRSRIVSANYYDAVFYNPDDMLILKAAIISAPGGDAYAESDFAQLYLMVNSVVPCLDSQGEQTVRLEGFEANSTSIAPKSYVINAEKYNGTNLYANLKGYENAKAEPGSVLRFQLDSRGEISKIKIYTTGADVAAAQPTDYYYVGRDSEYNQKLLGEAVTKDVSKKYLKVLVQANTELSKPYKSVECRSIVIYDSSKSKDKFSIGSIGEISTGDKVWMFLNFANPMITVVGR